jgi:hypothetical protein
MAVRSEPHAPAALYPQEDSWYTFVLEDGRIRSIEKYNDLIGNRTVDLPVCSVVPQPSTLPRVPSLVGASKSFAFACSGQYWPSLEGITKTIAFWCWANNGRIMQRQTVPFKKLHLTDFTTYLWIERSNSSRCVYVHRTFGICAPGRPELLRGFP